MILKLIDRSDFSADSVRNLTSDVVLYHGFQLSDMVRLEEQATSAIGGTKRNTVLASK